MSRSLRQLLRVAAPLAALSVAVSTIGCTNDPVRPEDWLHEHAPAAPPSPPSVQPAFVGFGNFFRTTRVGDSTYVIGYQLNRLGKLWLFKVVGDCEECDNWEEYAIGDFTLTGSTIVLRLWLIDEQGASRSGVYDVHGELRGDTLRLAYPDSMERLSPMFSSGDYVGSRREFP